MDNIPPKPILETTECKICSEKLKIALNKIRDLEKVIEDQVIDSDMGENINEDKYLVKKGDTSTDNDSQHEPKYVKSSLKQCEQDMESFVKDSHAKVKRKKKLIANQQVKLDELDKQLSECQKKSMKANWDNCQVLMSDMYQKQYENVSICK